MKTTQIYLVLSAVLCVSICSARLKACSCGNYVSGTYDYEVDDTTGNCCTGVPEVDAYYTTWVYSGGAYEVDDFQTIKGSVAQDKCCPSA